jgi:hypothetical protein
LSYLGIGSGPAQIRYLVRRLRRILPEGTLIVVAYWSRSADAEQVGAFLESTRADAYVTTLQEALDVCVNAATGELQPMSEEEEPAQASAKQAQAARVASPKGRKPQAASA